MTSPRPQKRIELSVGEERVPLVVPEATLEIDDKDEERDFACAEKVQEAFDHPIDFPVFSSAFVGGDRVALAIEPGLPQVEAVIESIVSYLLRHGIDAADLTVLLAEEDASLADPLSAQLARLNGTPIEVRSHDRQKIDSMGYLAAAHSAEPIYVDRALLEADVVLPVTHGRGAEGWAYAGLYGIVPWFTDAKTQQRWRHEYAHEDPRHPERQLRAAKEVAWLLGIQPVLTVVSGPAGGIDRILFGRVDQLEAILEQEVEADSLNEELPLVDLLVASIDGGPKQQTWDNVARILHFADRYLVHRGAVAIITEIEEKPGGVFRWLASDEDPEAVERHMIKNAHPHGLVAIEILRSRAKHPLYLMSRLPRESIEDFGLGGIDNFGELEHLIAIHGSTLIIHGAQRRRLRPRRPGVHPTTLD